MDFFAKSSDITKQRAGLSAVVVFDKALSSDATQADDKTDGLISKILKLGDFSGQAGQSLLLTAPAGLSSERLLLLGAGKKADNGLSQDSAQKIITALTLELSKTNARDAIVYLNDIELADNTQAWLAEQMAKQTITSSYQFDQCKSKKAPKLNLKKVTLSGDRSQNSAFKQGLETGKAVGEGMNFTRTLGNLPGNICTPRHFTKEAKRLAKSYKKLSVKALGEKEMKALGMNSLLSVSAGSVEPAQLVVMEYKGAAKSVKPHVLVGKGITFDTGGISLKPGAGMDEMKFDMCGAASVFGTLQAVMDLDLPINLVCIIAAAENMPAGNATKPGDIVTAMNGTTIEILNTDAEGRLVLCDALSYAERFKPQSVIDIATLTGACVIALGSHATGLYSNSEELSDALLSSGQAAGDRAWAMPLWDEYKKQLKSNFADLANIGGREAGSVTAACFLSHFTEKYDWAHLDIAGTAWYSGAKKGASGRPVPLLVNYLQGKAEKKPAKKVATKK